MKFLNVKTSLGIAGARLDLSLVQCQALNKMHSKLAKKYDDVIAKHEETKKDKWSKAELDTCCFSRS
jgi:hypothetical protein